MITVQDVSRLHVLAQQWANADYALGGTDVDSPGYDVMVKRRRNAEAAYREETERLKALIERAE